MRRPRLMAALRGSAAGPVVMLHAPAGYGKTAVLTEWAATDPRPCAWLSADRRA
jgi:LuxR family transcriptional regulator, maltose regulon positive regulatory protein